MATKNAQRKASKTTARFIKPMLALGAGSLPEGDHWVYELKLDGYRALGIKTNGKVSLRSRNDKDFTTKFPGVTKALARLPDETVVDGEVVAVDEGGRPSFNLLQNSASGSTILYYLFDVLTLAGRDVTSEPLSTRRELLEQSILPKLGEPIRASLQFTGKLAELLHAVREQGLEGLIAKRNDTPYIPGDRSGSWRKLRTNRGQEFVIGGYTRGGRGFDALVFGYYDGGKLLFAAKTRNGFTPALRQDLAKRFRTLETNECPFANLPEPKTGPLGTRTHRRKNEGVPVAPTQARRSVRVCRVDARQSPPARRVSRTPRRQRPTTRAPGTLVIFLVKQMT